jgi:hypothetical protein
VLVRLSRSAGAAGSDRIMASETLVSQPEMQFNAPRWSPDGRSIVAERHRLGALSEIIVVDVATRVVRVIASDPHARVTTPAWLPDGHAVVAAVAPEDAPFNLHEFPLDRRLPSRQVTHTTGGAIWPDIAPDAKSIVFVGYTPEGFDVFLMPYPTSQNSSASPDSDPFRIAGQDEPSSPSDSRVDGPVAPTTIYRPWRTLKPTSWFPILVADPHQIRVGAATSGTDVLGYHAYFASATWLTSRRGEAPALHTAVPDWKIVYAYNRWQPTFWAAVSRDTTFFAGPPTDRGVPSPVTRRTNQLEAGIVLPIYHVRTSQTAVVSVLRASDRFTLPGRTLSLKRDGVRAAWSMTSAHTYGYSISPEAGIVAGATAETVRRAFGSSGDADTWTADLRAYLPAVARHHVVALRLAAGASTGNPNMERSFLLGGALPNASAIDFGSRAISLLRGFASDTFAGTHVALVNADYRWPLARPQRGVGTWPLFVHTVYAAAFADVGQTWTRQFESAHVKTSVGAELSASFRAGYHFPFAATFGAARGHDGSGTVPDAWTIYLRIGHAF